MLKAHFRALLLAAIVVCIIAASAVAVLISRQAAGGREESPAISAPAGASGNGTDALVRISETAAGLAPTPTAAVTADASGGASTADPGNAESTLVATPAPQGASPETPVQATDRPQQRVPITRLAQSATPAPTSSQRITTSATATATRLASSTATVRTATAIPTSTPSPAGTTTPSATAAVAQVTATPVPTVTPLPTFAPPGTILGRLTWNGTPAAEGTELMLERDQSFVTTALATVGPDGRYSFSGIPPSDTGYNVVFAQEVNESQYTIDQVVSWSWIGPIKVASGDVIELPDFEISLSDWRPTEPAPEASFSVAGISAQNPMRFEWTPYVTQATYWIDLVAGDSQLLIWQSEPVEETSATFEGILTSGESISPGQHWWGVGGYFAVGAYAQTVYGYWSTFTVVP
jgi:hypothetical protein